MSKLRYLIAAAVLVVTTAVVAAPAKADEASWVTATCTADGGALSFTANVRFLTIEGGTKHMWDRFDFRLDGGTGGKSNVNIELWQDNLWTYTWRSGDNIRSGRWYAHLPPNPPVTQASRRELIDFIVYFDKFGPDPSCWATTPAV